MKRRGRGKPPVVTSPPAPATPRVVEDTRRVRRTHVLSANGKAVVGLTVECRTQERSVPLGECATCVRCRVMPVDPLSPEATVTCLSDVSAVSRKCDLDLAEEALRTFAGAVVPLDVVALHDDVTTDAARATFIERHVGVVAVFDAEDRALGAITWRELALSHDAVAVGEIVKPFGATFGEDAPLLHVLPALVGAGVAGVLTHDGDLVGVLAASDAVRWLARRAGFDV